MIRIDKITRGRWGNKVFQYNNLTQLSSLLDLDVSCLHWEGVDFFKSTVKYIDSTKSKVILYWNTILESDNDELIELTKSKDLLLDDPSYALHNTFFRLTYKDPREFMELKDRFKFNLDKNYIHIGIHIRGGDIRGGDGQDGREIHPPSYYINAIKYIESIKNNGDNKPYIYYICTDEIRFQSFIETMRYLDSNKLSYRLGKATQNSRLSYIYDFSLLSECDILINSSSTFCIAAGFLGKKDKKIIHYKGWMDKIVHGDFTDQEYKKYVNKWTHKYTDNNWLETRKPRGFWIDLYNGGNEYYKLWKTI